MFDALALNLVLKSAGFLKSIFIFANSRVKVLKILNRIKQWIRSNQKLKTKKENNDFNA